MHAIGYGKNEDIKNGTPQNIDILLVEQEVAASDDITAVQMVVAADTRRAALLEEAKEIELKLEEGGVKYCPVGKLDAVIEGNFAVGADAPTLTLHPHPHSSPLIFHPHPHPHLSPSP